MSNLMKKGSTGIVIIGQKGYQTVYLLIDCSGSMEGTKLQQAKDGALDFAKSAIRKGYSVGLISFGSDAIHICKPKNNIIDLQSHINSIYISGSTNMTSAIEMAVKKLGHETNSCAMLIATDGCPDNAESALRAAEKAKQKGIEILTIGTDDANINFLKSIATRTELADKVQIKDFGKAIGSMADKLALPENNIKRLIGHKK